MHMYIRTRFCIVQNIYVWIYDPVNAKTFIIGFLIGKLKQVFFKNR